MTGGMPRLGVVPHTRQSVTTVHCTNAYHETSGGIRLAQAIRAAVNGDESRLRAAAETARRFRWEAVTARYFAVYDELVLDRRLAAGWGTGESVGSASERSA